MKVSGKSHSAENPEDFFMLAKNLVSSKKIEGGFDENKLEKKAAWKKHRSLKKSDIACWA